MGSCCGVLFSGSSRVFRRAELLTRPNLTRLGVRTADFGATDGSNRPVPAAEVGGPGSADGGAQDEHEGLEPS